LKILYVIHDFLPRHRAGVQIYVSRLAKAIQSRGHRAWIFYTREDPLMPAYNLSWSKYQGLNLAGVQRPWVSSFEKTWHDTRMNEVFIRVLDRVKPELVHIHHLQHHSMGYVKIARSRHVPVVITLHDYYMLCPSPTGGQLFNYTGKACPGPTLDACATCLSGSPGSQGSLFSVLASKFFGLAEKVSFGVWPEIIERGPLKKLTFTMRKQVITSRRLADVTQKQVYSRMTGARAAVRNASILIAPSRHMKRKAINMKLVRARRILQMPYGFPVVSERMSRQVQAGGELKILFIGTYTRYKAPHILVEAANRLAHPRLKIRMFGNQRVDPGYVMELESKKKGNPGIEILGELKSAREVYKAMAWADLLVVPSTWEENWPLVIGEAFSSGLPVAASNIGGLRELLKNGRYGPLFRPGSATHLAATLKSFLDHPEKISRLSSNLPMPLSITRDCTDHLNLYRRLISRHANC